MTGMTWYEAAWYCNWLSQQEGIDQNQWCYEANGQNEFGPGMRPKPRFWTLTGYRLPLESEWEFACRAGAVTARHYGRAEELQGEYAWFVANGKNQAQPVGILKPNDFGLFDMHGNASEWCHDAYSDYQAAGESPRPDSQPITNDFSRILRGGSFLDQSHTIRAADRMMDLPANRNYTIGFRPVRTWQAREN
jgi:formylglycine-generating enzyme required for sulfatase activity